MRPSYTQIDSNLSRWIIRYCPRIMVVGPELRIIVELGNIINLSLGFYVTVLSCTNINANSIFRKIIPIQPTTISPGSRETLNPLTLIPPFPTNYYVQSRET